MGGGGERAARARAARHHADRGDADRRVPRPLRLGLRRRRSVRAVAPATGRPTTSAASSMRARGRHRRHPRRRLQPPRARRATTCAPFAPAYFTDRYENEWGDAINFDGPDAGPVREFFIANAGYWIDEFHFDGLRLDATQSIRRSPGRAHPRRADRHARARRRRARSIVIVAENEPQDTRLVRPTADGGYGLDALWNDDFHHSAMVALTGRAEAYYSDTAASRRSSSRPRSTAICSRGSTTRGSAIAAARPRWGCRRRRSSPSRRTTIRSRTPRAASAGTS